MKAEINIYLTPYEIEGIVDGTKTTLVRPMATQPPGNLIPFTIKASSTWKVEWSADTYNGHRWFGKCEIGGVGSVLSVRSTQRAGARGNGSAAPPRPAMKLHIKDIFPSRIDMIPEEEAAKIVRYSSRGRPLTRTFDGKDVERPSAKDAVCALWILDHGDEGWRLRPYAWVVKFEVEIIPKKQPKGHDVPSS